MTFFGSIIAVILWLFFYAGSFNVYQNIAVVVVIALAFIAVMGATWASWGMRQRGDWWSGRGATDGKTASAIGPRTSTLVT